MDDELVVCAVCGYPPNRTDFPELFDGCEYFHAGEQLRDHLIVPVLAREIQFSQRCDFCDGGEVVDVVVAEDFDTPLDTRSLGNWAACQTCGQLVRRRRWTQLAARVQQMSPQEMNRAFWLKLYRGVEVHMIEIITVDEWKKRARFAP
jgi:hypothetical protein